MGELSPGSGVYVFDQAIARKSATSCVSFLLNCFYTNMEMAGMNLTGAHGKSHPDKHIIESILGELLSVYLSNALFSVKINNGCNSKWL